MRNNERVNTEKRKQSFKGNSVNEETENCKMKRFEMHTAVAGALPRPAVQCI